MVQLIMLQEYSLTEKGTKDKRMREQETMWQDKIGQGEKSTMDNVQEYNWQ